MDCSVEIPQVLERVVQLPASKSIAARVLVINALCGETWNGDLEMASHDIVVMARALASDGDRIDVGAAGTAMRFLAAYFACLEGRTVVLDGTERMRQRPIGPLVDALRQMGASIEYLGNEGYPPLKIEGCKLHGGALTMRGDVSSQFVSALLMIAPLAGGVTLTLKGNIVSRPYIDMTIALMRHYGIAVKCEMPRENGNNTHPAHLKGRAFPCMSNQIIVPAGHYVPARFGIEGDWSAASYWFALKALLPESRIVLSPLFEDSVQGDRAIVEMMAPLGVECAFTDDTSVILTPAPLEGEFATLAAGRVRLAPSLQQGVFERDMATTPDLVPTLAVTLCLLRVPYVLTGVATLRIKESDRLEALREELAKLGYVIEVGGNSLNYNGNHTEIAGEVTLSPHGDHRLAMALSLAATRHNIVIKDAEVVSKSYPDWWEQLINA